MAPKLSDPSEALRAGIRACRDGRWRDGLNLLTPLAQQEERHGRLPGLFYSYLGHAIARCEGRKAVGMELCRHAVSIEPFRPENHLNLGYVNLLVGNRRGAVRALRRGLALDPDHSGLLELQRTLGVRRRPVLPFLSRSHPLNVTLGKVSARIRTGWAALRRYLRGEDEDEWGLDV
jgi:hypothetical protein